jgi:predicted RNase H-like HicB family nuclease
MHYVVIIEQAGTNYSAYVPDLPGCVATGATLDETRQAIRATILFHLEGMRAEGLPVPQSTSRADEESILTFVVSEMQFLDAVERGRADARAGRVTEHDTFMTELGALIGQAEQ